MISQQGLASCFQECQAYLQIDRLHKDWLRMLDRPNAAYALGNASLPFYTFLYHSIHFYTFLYLSIHFYTFLYISIHFYTLVPTCRKHVHDMYVRIPGPLIIIPITSRISSCRRLEEKTTSGIPRDPHAPCYCSILDS